MRIVAGVMVLLFTCAIAQASDATDIAKLLDKQDPFTTTAVYDADVVVIPPTRAGLTEGLTTPEGFGEGIVAPSSTVSTAKPKDKKVTVSADGKSAWATFTMKITQGTQSDTFRVSDLLNKTDKGWKIVATAWTVPVPNDVANKEAKSGPTFPPTFTDKDNDASLVTAFTKLTTDGLDATAAARKDLFAYGSGPNEKTTSGPVLAKAWKAAWQGKTTVSSIATRVSKAGTTGWVAAGVTLQKKGYTIAFMLFCIFEKTKAGEWSLVHAHFAI